MDPRIRRATDAVENAGTANYSLLGPKTRTGEQALGRYQVMPSSLADWGPKIFGRTVTPDEFLKDPKLQDQLYDAKMGEYVQRYGPVGAARAWFAGPGGMNNPNASDGYHTVDWYARNFSNALDAQQPQAQPQPQPQPLLNMPPPGQPETYAAMNAQQPRPGQPGSPLMPQQLGAQAGGGYAMPQMQMPQPQQLQVPPIQYYRPQLARAQMPQLPQLGTFRF